MSDADGLGEPELEGPSVTHGATWPGRTDHAYLKFAVTVSDDEPPAELLRIVHGCGRVLAAVVDRSLADAKAWHWGATDASGFAAMGIGELLVHAYDIAHGLGHDWRPPRDLAQSVVSRLHMGTRGVSEPSDLLLWSTGRMNIEGLESVDEWRWRAASR